MNPDFLQQQLLWRYATKHFDTDKPVADEAVKHIVEAMRMAPSSYGVQPWRFVVVSDPKVKAELRKVSYDQAQVTESSHLIVVASRSEVVDEDIDRYVADISETRKIPVENLSGFGDVMKGDVVSRGSALTGHWAGRQAYIALGFGLLSAALLEVDACPMEGFDHDAVTKLLGLDQAGYTAQAYLALGYRSPEDETQHYPKVRYDEAEVVE